MKQLSNEEFQKLRQATMERLTRELVDLLNQLNRRSRHSYGGSYWVQMFHDDFERIQALTKEYDDKVRSNQA